MRFPCMWYEMSVRFPRNLIVAFAAIVYTIAALPGEGLHLLGHIGHAHSRPTETDHSHAHNDCDHHSHQHCGDSSEHEAESPALRIQSVHEHDCPICQFFAQGQIQLPAASAPNFVEAVPERVVRVPAEYGAPDVRLHGSRAPPGLWALSA
jgi:hypothetical protein